MVKYNKKCALALIHIPENAIKLKITATVIDDDERNKGFQDIFDVTRTMGIEAIVESRRNISNDWEVDDSIFYIKEIAEGL